jgi:hypothetical protein
LVTYYVGDMLVTGDAYVNKGQAGVMGPSGTAGGNIFQQTWTDAQGSIDLKSLSADLLTLRKQLRELDQDGSHDIEIGAVAAAEKAAAAGDPPEVLNHLKAAGKWAFEMATKVGTSVAAAALKTALGL